jgi:phenylacetate-CoA ligase
MEEGLLEAITLANRTIKTVPAYQKLLKKSRYKQKNLSKKEDFFCLPITDKKNYIQSFSFFDLFQNYKWPSTAYSSSGSSGTPTFWFRDKRQNQAGGSIHEKIFKEIFQIKKQDTTLAIICFSMGIWVAGNYTTSSCQWVSEQGYRLTTITPGMEKHDIFYILKNLAPKFKNVILAGYPSFVMDILAEAKNKKIPLPKNLKLLTAGDSFSEKWRDSALKIIGTNLSLNSIISIYGSADAGIMGFETPLSVFIRKSALKNKGLYTELFGEAEKQPVLVQFNPKHTYLESIKGELLLTSNTSIPLIRYNIHDIGKILSFAETKKLLKKYNLIGQAEKIGLEDWQMPFIIKYGRTDVAVTFYALNIYPEHIEAGLKDKRIKEMVSGNFRAFSQTAKNNQDEQLNFEIELSEKYKVSKESLKKISNSVIDNLTKINTEFRKLHSTIGQKALPKIKLLKKLTDKTVRNSKILISLNGKKPKMTN